MVLRISLYKLKDDVSEHRIEELMRETRIQMLKLPEAKNVRCGKRIPQDQEWPFAISVEFESRDKMRSALASPVHVRFIETIIKPAAAQSVHLEFETDPFKDVRYS